MTAAAASEPVLAVENLVTGFDTDDGRVRAVDGVSFQVGRGRTLGIVGESGCGKTVTALSLIRLLPQPVASVEGGRALFEGEDLLALPVERLHRIRGNRIGMIFQEPMTALNPVHRIGRQITEGLRLHRELTDAEALSRGIEMLAKVGIPSPEVRMSEYPHQLSGGMRQRVMIAMALICDPALIIADEPTTALDVTIQAQILDLLQKMQDELGTSIIMITHDLGVIAETCDDVVVMYAGRIAEQGSVSEVFGNPRHPYTRGLLESIPRLSTPSKSRLRTIEGLVPSLSEMPAGCRFNNRCRYAAEVCVRQDPAIAEVSGGHRVACHKWREVPPGPPVAAAGSAS